MITVFSTLFVGLTELLRRNQGSHDLLLLLLRNKKKILRKKEGVALPGLETAI